LRLSRLRTASTARLGARRSASGPGNSRSSARAVFLTGEAKSEGNSGKTTSSAVWMRVITPRDRLVLGGLALTAAATGFGIFGAAAGATFSASTATVGMSVAHFAPVGVVVGPGTQRLISMLAKAGPDLEARTEAVAKWLPAGQKTVMTALEGDGRMLIGGAGEKARQIILQPSGETVVKALNVSKHAFETIAIIRPK
jgi:hypothetical protein